MYKNTLNFYFEIRKLSKREDVKSMKRMGESIKESGVTKDTKSERVQCNERRHPEMHGRSDINIERVRDKSEKEIEF